LPQRKVNVADWGSMMMISGLDPFIFSGWADSYGGSNFRVHRRMWNGERSLVDFSSGNFLGLSSGNWATLKKQDEGREQTDDVSGDVYSRCHITVNTVGVWDLETDHRRYVRRNKVWR
jgi:hypothetical protein